MEGLLYPLLNEIIYLLYETRKKLELLIFKKLFMLKIFKKALKFFHRAYIKLLKIIKIIFIPFLIITQTFEDFIILKFLQKYYSTIDKLNLNTVKTSSFT